MLQWGTLKMQMVTLLMDMQPLLYANVPGPSGYICHRMAGYHQSGEMLGSSLPLEMYLRFPILELCELDWKVDLITTDTYSVWYGWWSKNKIMVKDEPDDLASMTPVVALSKCTCQSSPEPVLKRAKVDRAAENVVMEIDTPLKSNPGPELGLEICFCVHYTCCPLHLRLCHRSRILCI
jgi:hypothetical protein